MSESGEPKVQSTTKSQFIDLFVFYFNLSLVRFSTRQFQWLKNPQERKRIFRQNDSWRVNASRDCLD